MAAESGYRFWGSVAPQVTIDIFCSVLVLFSVLRVLLIMIVSIYMK